MSSIVNFNTRNGQSSVEIPIDMDVVDKVEFLNRNAGRIRRGSMSRSAKNLEAAEADAEHHFLNPGAHGNGHRPSIAKPEFDDDDELDIEDPSRGNPGVDDGFFGPTETDLDSGFQPANGLIPRRRPSIAPTYPPGFGPPEFGVPGSTINGVNAGGTDFNAYQQRKTIAQGMMDLALLSANANQLRYVLESSNRHPYFYPSVVFISISIFFQIAVGIGLIINGRCSFKEEKQICKANRINNFTVIGIFVVTVVNVFISAFGVAGAPPDTSD